jgi:hypothetical protein
VRFGLAFAAARESSLTRPASPTTPGSSRRSARCISRRRVAREPSSPNESRRNSARRQRLRIVRPARCPASWWQSSPARPCRSERSFSTPCPSRTNRAAPRAGSTTGGT